MSKVVLLSLAAIVTSSILFLYSFQTTVLSNPSINFLLNSLLFSVFKVTTGIYNSPFVI